MPATGRAELHAGVHQRQAGAADGGHRGRAVALGDLADDPHRVGELVLGRQNRAQGAVGELAMADLTASRAAHAAGFTHRVGREVVVQHEVFATLALERVDHLFVLAGAEGGDAERLGLAAGEQGGAVGARQDADLGHDRADGLSIATVDAQPGVEDGAAHDVGLELLEQRLGCGGVHSLGGERLGDLLFGGADEVLPGLLLRLLVGFGDPGGAEFAHLGLERGFGFRRLGDVPRLLGRVLGEFDDGLDHRAHMVVAEAHGAEHDRLGQLLRLALDHQHAFGGAGDDEVELAAGELVAGRVEQVFTVGVADAGGRRPGRRTGCRRASARPSSRSRRRYPGCSPCRG